LLTIKAPTAQATMSRSFAAFGHLAGALLALMALSPVAVQGAAVVCDGDLLEIEPALWGVTGAELQDRIEIGKGGNNLILVSARKTGTMEGAEEVISSGFRDTPDLDVTPPARTHVSTHAPPNPTLQNNTQNGDFNYSTDGRDMNSLTMFGGSLYYNLGLVETSAVATNCDGYGCIWEGPPANWTATNDNPNAYPMWGSRIAERMGSARWLAGWDPVTGPSQSLVYFGKS
jgi:hypothetical protein